MRAHLASSFKQAWTAAVSIEIGWHINTFTRPIDFSCKFFGHIKCDISIPCHALRSHTLSAWNWRHKGVWRFLTGQPQMLLRNFSLCWGRWKILLFGMLWGRVWLGHVVGNSRAYISSVLSLLSRSTTFKAVE